MENKQTQVTEEIVVAEVVEDAVVTDTSILDEIYATDEFKKALEEVKSMTHEEWSTRLDELAEENKRLQEEVRENRLIGLKRDIERELDKRELTPFKKLFEVIDPTITQEKLLEQVSIIEQAVNEILASKSFQPKETAKQEAYEEAIANGDVQSAIGFKLSKLFGK